MSRPLATAVIAGAVGLAASQVFQERPWQAAIALAVAMLVGGLLALVDERHVPGGHHRRVARGRRRCGYVDLTNHRRKDPR